MGEGRTHAGTSPASPPHPSPSSQRPAHLRGAEEISGLSPPLVRFALWSHINTSGVLIVYSNTSFLFYEAASHTDTHTPVRRPTVHTHTLYTHTLYTHTHRKSQCFPQNVIIFVAVGRGGVRHCQNVGLRLWSTQALAQQASFHKAR